MQHSALNPVCSQTLGFQPSGSQPRKLLQNQPARPSGPFNLHSPDRIYSSVLLFRYSWGPPALEGLKRPLISCDPQRTFVIEWKKQTKLDLSASPGARISSDASASQLSRSKSTRTQLIAHVMGSPGAGQQEAETRYTEQLRTVSGR